MTLPPTVRALLWEYDLDTVPSAKGWQSTAIERVMMRGCWDDMRWLLREFDTRQLLAYLERRGRRVLPPRELRFWARICEVPEDEQDSWVHEARTRERAWR